LKHNTEKEWKSQKREIRVTVHRKNQREKKRQDQTGMPQEGQIFFFSLFIMMFSGF
jgi:hypothetical protein